MSVVLIKASVVKKSAEEFLQVIPQACKFLTGRSYSPSQCDSPLQEIFFFLI